MTFKVKDHFYKKAKDENYLARSIYKLEEIDAKYKVLKVGDNVLDLGYYPGSWIQYTSKKIGPNGKVIGIDIKPVNTKLQSLKNVTVYEKDIFDINGPSDLSIDNYFDVVVSDMAPNTTGIKSVDQIKSLELVQKVIEVLPKLLKENGNFVIKVFESQEAQDYFKSIKDLFNKISFLRPKSTRSVSKEYFVIGEGYKLK
jgi:23S rRNA (uridine2552-2'-O)-methyltransferase